MVLSIQEIYQRYHFDVLLLFSVLAKAIHVIKLDILVGVTVFKKVIYMIRMRSFFVVSVY